MIQPMPESGDPRAASLAAHLRGLETWGLRFTARGFVARSEEVHPTEAESSAGTETAAGPSAPPSPPVTVPPPDAGEAASPPPAAFSPPEPVSAGTAPPPVARESVGEPETPADDRDLAAIRAEVEACVACRLHEGRQKTVFGVGDPDADLMFVGEGPGAEEDQRGEPFVGKAGQLLDKIISAMGTQRHAVYIANVVKCRPPGNRTPTIEEAAMCSSYLQRQIRAVRPKVLVALGKPAANTLLGNETPVGRLRGRLHQYQGIPLVVTYHPAYLLRNPAAKRDVWLDMQAVIEQLGLEPPVPYQR